MLSTRNENWCEKSGFYCKWQSTLNFNLNSLERVFNRVIKLICTLCFFFLSFFFFWAFLRARFVACLEFWARFVFPEEGKRKPGDYQYIASIPGG